MTDYLDLQIGLDRWFSSNYRLELQVTQSDSDTSNAPLQTLIQFDFEELLGLTNDNIEYGRALTNTLFAAAEVRNKFSEACSIAENMDRPLRIHLLIAPRASELHDLRWETLHDPRQDSGLLVTNERILF